MLAYQILGHNNQGIVGLITQSNFVFRSQNSPWMSWPEPTHNTMNYELWILFKTSRIYRIFYGLPTHVGLSDIGAQQSGYCWSDHSIKFRIQIPKFSIDELMRADTTLWTTNSKFCSKTSHIFRIFHGQPTHVDLSDIGAQQSGYCLSDHPIKFCIQNPKFSMDELTDYGHPMKA